MYSESTHEILYRRLDDLLDDFESVCNVIEIFNEVLALNVQLPKIIGNVTLTCEITVNVTDICLPADINYMTTDDLLTYLDSEIGFDLASEVCNSGRLDNKGYWDIDFNSIEDWERS